MANGTSSTKGTTSTTAAVTPEEENAAKGPVNNLPQSGIIDPWSTSSNDDKIDWIKNNTTVEDPQKAFDAIKAFTDGSFSSIRDAQKAGKDNEYGKMGQTLEDYIPNAPQWDNSHDLHRGMGLDKKEVQDILNGIGTGKAFDVNNGGTASWSKKYSVSEGFANAYGDQVPVIFRAKKMSNATPVMHLSQFKSEYEVLSSKKNMFKPVKAIKKNIHGKQGYIIEVEEI